MSGVEFGQIRIVTDGRGWSLPAREGMRFIINERVSNPPNTSERCYFIAWEDGLIPDHLTRDYARLVWILDKSRPKEDDDG